MMRTGWEIVIAGSDFDPGEFFQESRIQPDRISQQEMVEDEKPYHQLAVEFSGWQEGEYALDMVTEALDYLKENRAEFEKLCSLPGIEWRSVNFVDCPDGVFEFSTEDLSLLAALGFSVSTVVVPQK